MRSVISFLLTAVAVVGALLAPVRADEPARMLVPVEGKPSPARLMSVDASGKFTFENPKTKKTIQLTADELVRWGDGPPPASDSLVLTVAGGQLSGTPIALGDKFLLLDSRGLTSDGEVGLRVPLSAVVAIILRAAPDEHPRDRLIAELRRARPENDVATLVNGDRIVGTIVSYDTTKDNFPFQIRTDAGLREVPERDVATLALSAALIERPRLRGPRQIVSLAGGSQLTVTSVKMLDSPDPKVHLTVAGGYTVDVKPSGIVGIQPLGGRVTYLSDLKPAAYKYTPYLKLSWPYHADRNAEGSPLRVGDRQFAKGLGMHSPSRLTYRLAGKHQRFEAELAVDAAAGHDGSIQGRVYLLHGDQWKQAYASGTLRGGDPPTAVSVDLAGARAMTLIVEPADRGDQRDLADWLDARLIGP